MKSDREYTLRVLGRLDGLTAGDLDAQMMLANLAGLALLQIPAAIATVRSLSRTDADVACGCEHLETLGDCLPDWCETMAGRAGFNEWKETR